MKAESEDEKTTFEKINTIFRYLITSLGISILYGYTMTSGILSGKADIVYILIGFIFIITAGPFFYKSLSLTGDLIIEKTKVEE